MSLSGERCSVQLVKLLESMINSSCYIWNLCGPAETTLQSLFHRVDSRNDEQSVPLGQPLPDYHCLVVGEFDQSVVGDQEGEVLMGGVGIFAGYFDRDDLTAKVLVNIDDDIYYRTGDLVRMDNNGVLHHVGRKDFQIKLRGQRIEIGEIERCLLNASVSACIVIKWGEDHLVAYVQSSDITEDQLREHCQSHLPPHMVPSMFILLDKLPLNANGKVDRKQLPMPDFSSRDGLSQDQDDKSLTELEQHVYGIWCQVLRLKDTHLSKTKNFFSVGGHSLLFIDLYHRYQTMFEFDIHVLSIAPFLTQPTIAQHAKLIEKVLVNQSKSMQWHPLHLIKGTVLYLVLSSLEYY